MGNLHRSVRNVRSPLRRPGSCLRPPAKATWRRFPSGAHAPPQYIAVVIHIAVVIPTGRPEWPKPGWDEATSRPPSASTGAAGSRPTWVQEQDRPAMPAIEQLHACPICHDGWTSTPSAPALMQAPRHSHDLAMPFFAHLLQGQASRNAVKARASNLSRLWSG
jgi:hypothetical protein